MPKKESQSIYVSPQVKTIEIKTHSIICQSRGNKSMWEVYYLDGGFEEEL